MRASISARWRQTADDLGQRSSHEQPLRTQRVEVDRSPRCRAPVTIPSPTPPRRASRPSSPSRISAPMAQAASRDQYAGDDPDNGVQRRRGAEHQPALGPVREPRPSPAPPSSPRCCEARAGSPPARPRARRHRARPPTGVAPAPSRSRAGRRVRSPGRSVARAPRMRAGGPRRAPAHPRGTAQPRAQARVECTLPGRRHVPSPVTAWPGRRLAEPRLPALAPARCLACRSRWSTTTTPSR